MLDINEYINFDGRAVQKYAQNCHTQNNCQSVKLTHRERVPDVAGETHYAGNNTGLITIYDNDPKIIYIHFWYHTLTRTYL